MRIPSFAVIALVSLSASAAFAQTSSPPAPATPPAVQAPPSAASPDTVPAPRAASADGKRAACRQDVAAKGLRGQDQRDQMQLCLAQGQLDCVRQAIDQKIIGPQRRDFIKTCMGTPFGRMR